jgi:hypothetical protein
VDGNRCARSLLSHGVEPMATAILFHTISVLFMFVIVLVTGVLFAISR